MQFELSKPMAVIAHDAGGANQIFALIKENGGALGVRAYLEGPASLLWSNFFPDHKLSETLDSALEGTSLLLAGSGWGSDLELKAIQKAKDLGIKSIVMLDHWVNYKERLMKNDVLILPDEFWVVDYYAKDIADLSFPNTPVLLKPNYYEEYQLRLIKNSGSTEKYDILYVLEPVRNDWGKGEPGEFQALRYFFSNINKIGISKPRVLLRPHPSEIKEKYQAILKGYATEFNITIDDKTDLANAIAEAKVVVGCQSKALTVALAAGKVVYTSLPPWAPTISLPHRNIESM